MWEKHRSIFGVLYAKDNLRVWPGKGRNEWVAAIRLGPGKQRVVGTYKSVTAAKRAAQNAADKGEHTNEKTG